MNDRDHRSERAEQADPVAALLALLRARSRFADGALSAERVRAHLAARAAELAPGGDLARCASRIAGDPGEYALLEAAFSPPETWLFRYPASFEFLRALAARGERRGAFRVLMLGCGGWCEPVSAAAALDGPAASGVEVAIRAIDRNPALLAGEPTFVGMQLRGGLPEFARPLFEPDGRGLRPIPRLLRRIRVEAGDAATTVESAAAGGERHDAIFFRNVAIYLDDAARGRIFAAIARALAPGGALFVGHAEEHAAALATGLVSAGDPGAFALVAPLATASGPERASQDLSPRPRGRETSAREAPVAGERGGARHVAPSRPVRPGDPAAVGDPVGRARADLARRPAEADAHLGLARALEDAGDPVEALAAVRRALYLDRRSEDALVLAARLADALGRLDEAARFRARAIEAHLGRVDGVDRPDSL